MNRLNECCAVQMESVSLSIVLHMLDVTFVAVRAKRIHKANSEKIEPSLTPCVVNQKLYANKSSLKK